MHLPAEAVLGGEGQAFAIAQTRLGGGRIHHAMRTIGMARRGIDAMCERALSRQVSGGLLADKQFVQGYIADSYAQLMQFRLYVLYTAWLIDKHNNYQKVRKDIAAIKVLMPGVLHDIAWRAIQIHGALGVSNEMPFHSMMLAASVMGLADGPTEVHKVTVARQVLRDHRATDDLWPTQHLPKRRDAAREKFAELLEHEVGKFLMIDTANGLAALDGRPGPRRRARRSSTRSSPVGPRTRSTRSAEATCTAPCGSRRRRRRRPATTGSCASGGSSRRSTGPTSPTRRPSPPATTRRVLGRTFYLMGYVDGWSPMNTDGWPAPFDTDLEARKGLAFELVDGIALLSKVDWQAKGLADLGHPDGFHDRQVDRWTAFLERIKGRELPGFDEASAWLRAHRPIDFIPGLMHGDYQFANVMYRHGAPARMAAIVDWEMGTVGDPKLDLAWVVNGVARGHRTTAPGISYVDMTRDAVAVGRARALCRGVRPPGRRHRLLLRPGQVEAGRRPGAGVTSGPATTPLLQTYGPVVLDLMQGAAELAETADYQS